MKSSRIIEGIKTSVENKLNILIFSASSVLTFAFVVSAPYYSFVIRNLTDYRYNLPTLGIDLVTNLYLTSGATGLILTAIFALLTGILFTNIYADMKRSGLSSVGYITSALPGFIAGGCAACGAALIPLLGIGVAGVLFPFSGNLWRLASILVVIFALTKINDEKTCEV